MSTNKDEVILHQIPRGPNAPSMSPFCLKLETYFRLAKIPFRSVHSMKMSPEGKVPWIEHEGKIYSDSAFIIDYVNKKFNISNGLTQEQLAISRAFQKMAEESLNWYLPLYRFVWRGDPKSTSFMGIPKIGLWYMSIAMKKRAAGAGIGVHTRAEIEKIIEQDLTAISHYLGSKPFMMGDEPSELDATIFGILGQMKWQLLDSLATELINNKLSNLCAYLERMKARLYPDWDECNTHYGTKKATK